MNIINRAISGKYRAAVLSLVLLSAGCVSIPSVPAGEYKVTPTYSLNLGRIWSDVTKFNGGVAKKVKVLTIDGPLLNALFVAGDLKAGEGLMNKVSKEKLVPVVKAQMSSSEQIEFLKDSFTAIGYLNVASTKPRQVQLSGKPAIRVDFTGSAEDGLELAGTGIIQKLDDSYNVLIFVAPKEHYFDAMLQELNKLAGSV